MSIQASLNQLLGIAAIGAGIYAQTPAAKEKVQVKALTRKLEGVERLYDEESEYAPAEEIANFETSERYKESLDEGYELAHQRALLDPSKENVRAAATYRQGRATAAKARQEQARAEEAALAAQTQAQEQRRNQAEAIDVRKISLQQIEALRAAGAISNREAKSLTHKINKFGGEN